jgi:tetratricopeptide (TPR) repeat protein
MASAFSSRWTYFAVAAALLPIGAWMIHNRLGPALAEPYWNRYLRAQVAAGTESQTRENGDPATRQSDSGALETEQKILDDLEKVVFWDPDHARAHLALAETHLRLFDKLQAHAKNRMPLMGICDAARNSRFASREMLHRWLGRAVGDHWRHLQSALEHCRRSLSLCPLQGHGYLYLAELSFLEGEKGLSKRSCLDQALRLRPFDGQVAYTAAAEALLAGDAPRWLELLRQSSRCSCRDQRRIIDDLVGGTPPEQMPKTIDFVTLRLQPDPPGWRYLYEACAKRCSSEQLVFLRRYEARAAESEARSRDGSEAAVLWLLAEELRLQSGDGPQALDCARRALQCSPNDYHAHYQLALCLMNQGQFAEAETHWRWCRQRSPVNKDLENRIREAVKGRLKAERSLAGPTNEKFQ